MCSTLNDLKLEHLLGLLGLPGRLAKMPRLVAEKYQKLGKQINKLCLSVYLDTVLQSQLQSQLELELFAFGLVSTGSALGNANPESQHKHTHTHFS